MARKKWPEVLAHSAEIVRSYDTPVTLRQLFYRLVSDGTLRNTTNDYKGLSRASAQARRAGEFPALRDTTRRIAQLPRWESPLAAVRQLSDEFTLDRTRGQDVQTWLVLEKETLFALCEQVADQYGIPVTALKGYGSQTIYDQMYARMLGDGRGCYIVYVGDFDPSGVDIARDLQERLGYWNLEVNRVAVNYDQIEEYDLPPQYGKATDSRAAAFIEREGTLIQVEAEAIDPAVIQGLVEDGVRRYIDLDLLADVLADEEDARSVLSDVADGLAS